MTTATPSIPAGVRALAAAALGLAALLAAPGARADIVDPVTISLFAPGGLIGSSGPVSVTDVVDPAVGIGVGDGSNIGGGWMLPGEAIRFSGNTITIDIAAGDVNDLNQPVTGYLGAGGAHARYELAGLAVPGQSIVGFTGGFTGLAAPGALASFVTLASPHVVTVDLDSLVFSLAPGQGQSDALATVTINLSTLPVPEPSPVALMLAGGLCLAGAARARSRRA